MPKALVVEDDELLGVSIVDALECEHYTVELVTDGEEALFRLQSYEYDVMILDWEMPKLTGIEVCRQYRKQGGMLPILFLTGKSSDADKVAGLDSGADDYLVKPFVVSELCARLRALLRRASSQVGKTSVLKGGSISLDTTTYEVLANGRPVSLLPKEIALLEYFMRHPKQYFSSKALLDKVWSSESEVSEETLRSNISRLRAKLSNGKNSCIETERGLGYRFNPDCES